MKPIAILAAYVALAVLDLAWGLFLTVLNYRSVSRRGRQVPEELAASLSAEEVTKASAYSKAKMRMSFVAGPIMTAIVVVAAASGLFGLLDGVMAGFGPGRLLARRPLPRRHPRCPDHPRRPDLFVLDLLPREALRLQHDQGADLAPRYRSRAALISVVLGLPLLYLLYAFIDGAGSLWWLWAAAIFSLINLPLA